MKTYPHLFFGGTESAHAYYAEAGIEDPGQSWNALKVGAYTELTHIRSQRFSLRVTLSYFVEPSPGRRGWSRKHRYPSHGLRFAVQGPVESDEAFRQRISKADWNEDEEQPATGDPLDWLMGKQLRTRGSIHSDVWRGNAAEIASCGYLAIFPVTGWWRERKHLDRYHRKARYSLIISLETDDTQVDLYTPIKTQIAVPLPVVVEV